MDISKVGHDMEKRRVLGPVTVRTARPLRTLGLQKKTCNSHRMTREFVVFFEAFLVERLKTAPKSTSQERNEALKVGPRLKMQRKRKFN